MSKAKKIRTASSGGMARPDVTVGKIDPEHARIARTAVGAGGFGMGRQREAGMLIDTSQVSAPYSTGYKLEAYRSSYAYGLSDRTGAYDIPTYFVQMNEQNGGMLYWPITLAEKNSWYRYFCYYLDGKHLAQVLMEDGTLKSIKDVQVGDRVITGTGVVRRVSKKIERKCHDTKAVEIKAWCLQNNSLVTHEHPFYVLRASSVKKDSTHYRKNIEFNPEWINADRIVPGDYVLMAPYKPEKISDLTVDQAAFLGYYASEGSIAWGLRCVDTISKKANENGKGWKWHQKKVQVPDGVVFTLNKNEEDSVARRIIELAMSAFGVKGKIVRRRENHIEILVSGRNVGEFCHRHVGCGSLSKKLSKDMMDASIDAKKAFLLTYAEGDGHQYSDANNNGKLLIATASDDLASQTQMLALSAGIMCRIAKYERKNDPWSDNPLWHIIIPAKSADTLIVNSSKCHKSNSAGHKHGSFMINGYAAFKVEKISYCEKDDLVYNLELDADGDDKSYICNGMVTHNCRTDAYIGRAMELLSDLPMSKLTLNMPKMEDKELCAEIKEFFEYQLEVLNMFELCQNILWETNMIGNCLTGDTPILTKNGFYPISEIKDGDIVVDNSGVYSRVLKTTHREVNEKINRIQLERMSGYSERVTDEHPYFILKDGKEVMSYAKNITKDDWIAVPKIEVVKDRIEINIFENAIGMNSCSSRQTSIGNIPANNDMLYVIGCWMGIGHLLPKCDTFDLCFDNQETDPEMVESLRLKCESVFGSAGVSKENVSVRCGSMTHIFVKDELLCKWWVDNFRTGKSDKVIPSWVMELPAEKLVHLLKGMIDATGSVFKTDSGLTVRMNTRNKQLAQQLFHVGIKCGFPMRFEISKHKSLKSSYPVYFVMLEDMRYVPKLISGCYKDIKSDFALQDDEYKSFIELNGHFYYKVLSNKRVQFKGSVYNFEVEDSHTYCTLSSKLHNCFIFNEWDEKKKMWSKAVMLPPEEVYVFQFPFTDKKRVEYRPQRIISLIKSDEGDAASELPKGDYDRSAMNEEIVAGIPQEMKEMVKEYGCIVMDTDPMTGSFVHHIARRRSLYMDLGASVLERVLVPMLQKEHYRYTQLSLASRNMTPKNLITAPGLMPEELDNLRTQVDLSYMDPEYSVITNYEVTWQQIGVQDRFLDFSREYEQIENQVFAALGVTRELLTGEGQFSGTKITVEILNTMFLLSREVIKSYIEKQLFIPICEAHGWFTIGKNGIKKYLYPEVGFNRLTIRDNAEVFDSLFQLYSKGSLPVEVIYELFNLNADDMHNKLLKGLFTANDSTFNRLTEEVNQELGRVIVQKTDVLEKAFKYLGLKVNPQEDAEGNATGESVNEEQSSLQPESGKEESVSERSESSGYGDTVTTPALPDAKKKDTKEELLDPDEVAKEIADVLPADASEKDIQEGIDAVAEEAGKGE